MKETDENSSEEQKKGFFEKIKEQLFHETPENRKELLDVLHDSCEQKLFNSDALHMIEGVLRVSELRADDIMIPRAQMKVIDVSDDPKEWFEMPFIPDTPDFRQSTATVTMWLGSFLQKTCCVFLTIRITRSLII